jgi:hypothetical protein
MVTIRSDTFDQWRPGRDGAVVDGSPPGTYVFARVSAWIATAWLRFTGGANRRS